LFIFGPDKLQGFVDFFIGFYLRYGRWTGDFFFLPDIAAEMPSLSSDVTTKWNEISVPAKTSRMKDANR
jgi:hypothetical protein